ncbi:hypothetical protein L1987_27790 [Smallanthus sonchifolius]|uniref:Uncharacterized protein n=1 Tax=Smallanthus sonchifolius TaxID=185202 RepID=A0ACB9IBQ9_9ASTR|nr:hypothetical protein L1987_27790 [Smallanthus sonchifolius]
MAYVIGIPAEVDCVSEEEKVIVVKVDDTNVSLEDMFGDLIEEVHVSVNEVVDEEFVALLISKEVKVIKKNEKIVKKRLRRRWRMNIPWRLRRHRRKKRW